MSTTQERPEVRAQLILEVAKAASSHLELSEVLEALLVALRPTSHFDAIALSVIEGESVRLHSLHVEELRRKPAEPVMKQRLREHHISLVASTLEPYVCSDLQTQKRFPMDERLLQHG